MEAFTKRLVGPVRTRDILPTTTGLSSLVDSLSYSVFKVAPDTV